MILMARSYLRLLWCALHNHAAQPGREPHWQGGVWIVPCRCLTRCHTVRP